jgi:Primase C terminal 1 (PriCT-1)
MPTWLIEVLKKAPTPKLTSKQWEELVHDGAETGLRHPSILKLVGHLLARKVHPQVVLELAHAYNEARCRPPKSPAEVFKIVNWCAGQQLAREGLADGR